jgi:hypothetical protein
MAYFAIADRVPVVDRADIVMIKLPSIATALLLIQCWPAVAADADCMNDYYRTKLPGCVDSTLSQFRQMPRSKSDPATMIGFLAQFFSTSPEEKLRVLNDEPSEYLRSVYLVALYRAGLLDDARKYADKIDRSPLLQKLATDQLKPLAAVRPSSVPADNDLLIGAYMASGDTVFIERILQNFSSADDDIASDGLRMGFMQGKFGPTLVPKQRENVTLAAACAKYQCKTDPAKLFRVMTLTTAFWALQSMAQHDDGVRKTLAGFFEHDARLKNLLAVEQNAFANYLTTVVAVIALKPDQASAEASPGYAAMSKSALAYETLKSAGEAFAPFNSLSKSGKQPN